jgi:asparagine synthase (glutamine-hydrolysing)
MCGLAGLIHSPSMHPDVLRDSVNRMAGALAHRGPDDEGSWVHPDGRVALGFRRLAVMDLSHAGHQPMRSPSGRYTAVFNGEIYNFRALRGALPEHEARGHSDTEVLLHAFDSWGVRATLPRLVGMFAIGVWDESERELWLARDRLGIKPLYMARTTHGVAFGSELSAIMAAPGFDARVAVSSLPAFLEYLYYPGTSTPLAGVHKLLPGHLVRIRDPLSASHPDPEMEAWWSLGSARTEGGASVVEGGLGSDGQRRALEMLDSLLTDAVELRMVADVPVGALLSGGIDSSLVVARMQALASVPVRTFTVAFDDAGHDESAHARAVATHLGTDHTELEVTGQDALDLIPGLPRIFDEPIANPSQIPTYLVSALARRHVTVALTGDGGDELFAGYNRHVEAQRLLPWLGRLPRSARRLLAGGIEALSDSASDGSSAAFRGVPLGSRITPERGRRLARMLRPATRAEMYRALITTGIRADRLMPSTGRGADPIRSFLDDRGHRLRLDDILELDQSYYLPGDLLQKVDRASMAVGLEARVPLLDHRVVEFSWRLPGGLRTLDGKGKWPLRQLLYRQVPRELVDRPKVGFTVPLSAWLAGPLRPWAEELLLGPSPSRDLLFEPQEIQRAWMAFRAGRTEEAPGLWALLSFESWRSHWGVRDFDREMQCAS